MSLPPTIIRPASGRKCSLLNLHMHTPQYANSPRCGLEGLEGAALGLAALLLLLLEEALEEVVELPELLGLRPAPGVLCAVSGGV